MSDPKKEEKPKEFPWGMMIGAFVGIILLGIGISIGLPAIGQGIAGFMRGVISGIVDWYNNRVAVHWGISEFLFFIIVVALGGALIMAVFGKKEEHHAP